MKHEVSVAIPDRVLALLIPSLLFAFQLTAQSTVNTRTFFAQTAAKTVDKTTSDQGSAPKMPWIETYELRTETRDFDFEKQEYTLRLSPNTRRKYKAQMSLYRHQEAAPDFDGQEAICDALRQQYEDWLQLYLINVETQLLDRLELVLNDRATVLSRLSANLNFEWSELIALREDRTDLDLRRARLKLLKIRLTGVYGISASLNFDDMADLSDLYLRLQNSTFNFADPKMAYELEQIARELDLERAEQRQFLDFAQVRYQGPHEDPARERLSVGVGLQLPLSGNRVIKVRELELEEAALREEINREKEDQTNDHQARKSELMTDFEYHFYAAETFAKEREELSLMADQLRKKEGFNPLPLLKIKERELRNELRQLRLSAQLYENYLRQMERSGKMCEALKGELLLR